MIAVEKEVNSVVKCYHCGQPCEDEIHVLDHRKFCCFGCKTVYEILSQNQLCEYYDLDEAPGVRLAEVNTDDFAYVDQEEVRARLLSFASPTFCRVTFRIPSIHCVSCIWLLENLYKLQPGITRSEVVFGEKRVTIDFDPRRVKLSGVVRVLASIGYTPELTKDSAETPRKKTDRTLLFKIAVAGFCFGNVMMFSFPEYLGITVSDEGFVRMFGWLNLVLSLPVFFYSGWDYLTSAVQAFRQRQINLDVPIAAGLLALLFRSSWEIITASGAGYFDSLNGLVFFLLIGRWFQSKTYATLSFDRDFTAYFPIAVNKLIRENGENEWSPTVIYKLRRGDIIQIRNMEIIPADSTLLDERAFIDYSFVTGEAKPVRVQAGERVYAGGRLIGTPVRLTVEKPTSQSELTSLWNNEAFRKEKESRYQKVIDRVARRFTWVVLFIAVTAGIYWYMTDPTQTWLVVTAILIVACPCALALSAPFTYGSTLRAFGKHHLYLKNADIIERMAAIDAVVFDKTGTVTHGTAPTVRLHGNLSSDETSAIKLLTGYSTHPLSKLVTKSLPKAVETKVTDFSELPGKGIEGTVGGKHYRIGSAVFTNSASADDLRASHVYVSVDSQPRGYYVIKTSVRPNIGHMLRRLGSLCTALVSGDHDGDKPEMKKLFPEHTEMRFNQTPQQKLAYIEELQQQGKKVMMLGDGLNDAGALRQSDVGIAVTDDSGLFTPASDGILDGRQLEKLDTFLELSRDATKILKTAFVISFCYNAVALSFAVTGHLTPLVAAILMPLSSISVVCFTTLAVNFTVRRKLKI